MELRGPVWGPCTNFLYKLRYKFNARSTKWHIFLYSPRQGDFSNHDRVFSTGLVLAWRKPHLRHIAYR